MDLEQYESLTGNTVTSSQQTRVIAKIERSRRILESMLGYTLDITKADTNYYTEIGKTAVECPCPTFDMDSLTAADEVQGAYRLFPYNYKDKFLKIDPAATVYAVKLVQDGVTFRTFESSEYHRQYDDAIITNIVRDDPWCTCSYDGDCYCSQLAVDADWLWDENDIFPDEINDIWAEMAEYLIDTKKDIKSQTLGSHSYTRFDRDAPEQREDVRKALMKYAGPNGTLYRTITI